MSIGPLSPTLALVTKLVAKPDEADEVLNRSGMPRSVLPRG